MTPPVPRPSRSVRAAVLAVAGSLTVLTGAGCAAAPAPAAATSAAAPSTPATTSAVPQPEARVVRIAYSGGRASGDTGTVSVTRGETVRLEVTSDVAEEAHLHGYDREVRLAPGVPATIDLTADIPGEFEFELHSSGAQLATLQVR
ncbi:hypothetical protein [Pseudonocardia sp. HH130629-09]|uniref:hypothetical protein n=1 Tax=Pseudonocardia sp. HH130629-09 TaxID=1641402 RepID=UPI0007613383|nr:hypothetical protein [Pseudonocardia sp. HH130629-09]